MQPLGEHLVRQIEHQRTEDPFQNCAVQAIHHYGPHRRPDRSTQGNRTDYGEMNQTVQGKMIELTAAVTPITSLLEQTGTFIGTFI